MKPTAKDILGPRVTVVIPLHEEANNLLVSLMGGTPDHLYLVEIKGVTGYQLTDDQYKTYRSRARPGIDFRVVGRFPGTFKSEISRKINWGSSVKKKLKDHRVRNAPR